MDNVLKFLNRYTKKKNVVIIMTTLNQNGHQLDLSSKM